MCVFVATVFTCYPPMDGVKLKLKAHHTSTYKMLGM